MRRFSAAMLAVSLCAGCVYHIDAAITDDLSMSNAGLVGTWSADDTTRVVITAAGPSRFEVHYTAGTGDPVALNARLGRIDTITVLELWPMLEAGDDWPVGRIIYTLTMAPDSVAAASLEVDSVRAELIRAARAVPHLTIDRDIVLTASGPQLRETLADFLRRPGFLNPTVWVRQK